MASKSFLVDGIGDITVYKRRGTRKMNLRVVAGKIKVSQPTWLPYASGVQFAGKNKQWIVSQLQQTPVFELYDGMPIGKQRRLELCDGDTLKTRLSDTKLTITIPQNLTVHSAQVIGVARAAIKRALKKEAMQLLPSRVAVIAQQHNFSFSSVYCKSLKSRWGSCTNQKAITLNIFLMMAPWELIDYVIVHELAHTEHLHHGPDFWEAVAAIVPDYKQRRKDLKIIQTSIAPLQ